jgi:hypothetical protein
VMVRPSTVAPSVAAITQPVCVLLFGITFFRSFGFGR